MEKLNDLLGYNIKIFQDDDFFKYNLDSILLAEFVELKSNKKNILDIGAGTGAISLVLSTKTNQNIDAIEIQKKLSDLFTKTIKYNKLEDQISLYNEDIKKSVLLNRNNYYDIIVCNPPYFKNGKFSPKLAKSIARHEEFLNINDIAKVSKKLLNNNGSLYIVYNSERLIEALEILKSSNLIPKRLKFIHTNLNKSATIFLLECVKNGNDGLKIEPPFILYNKDGEKTDEYTTLIETKEEEK